MKKYQLVSYDYENGITIEGYFNTHKEAYQAILDDIANWNNSESFTFPKHETIKSNNCRHCIFDEEEVERGICYSDSVYFWDDYDTTYHIVKLPMIADKEEAEKYCDAIRTVISFLDANEQYGDDWKEEIDTLTNLIIAIYQWD